MLFNNFVEGSLKLKPFDVHITQTIVKKIKMKAFIFFLQIAQLIETSYLYIYIYILLQIFLKSFDASNHFNINFPWSVSKSKINFPKILQLSTYHDHLLDSSDPQLSFNSPSTPPNFPSKSLQNHSSTSNHPDELSTDILQKNPLAP